jgi:hypothetical protein
VNRDRTQHCCLCGDLRRPTQRPVESFGNACECITIADHRPLQEGRWEVSPQLLVNVSMWRNGGTDYGNTHICDGCIVVGLQAAKQFVDESLYAFSFPRKEPRGPISPAARVEDSDLTQGHE